jgi:hypothetical protein
MPNTSAMTEPPRPPEAAPAQAWFVQAAGQVWGPYSPARLARFVVEGRVTPESLVAAEIEGPFHAASRWRSLAPLFHAPKRYHHQPAPVAGVEPTSDSVPAAQTEPQPSAEAQSSASATRPLLIWAELASLSPDRFEALVARYGAVVALRPTVWLVQARCDAAALRNALSRRLTGADALLIVQAPLDQAAWFNLDSAAERRLREVWGGGG